jgi:hypothetical protein
MGEVWKGLCVEFSISIKRIVTLSKLYTAEVNL